MLNDIINFFSITKTIIIAYLNELTYFFQLEIGFDDLIKSIIFIGQGITLTLELMFGGIIIGLILGTLLSIARHMKIASLLIRSFISVIRGTPLLLQLSLLYFTLPSLFSFKCDLLTVGIIAFGINSSAYVAEILRSGIESLPKGQFEAAQTLQIPRWLMWKDIILPQVVHNVLPSLVNEFIALLKETAIISTLGGMDIMRRAQSVAAEQFTYFIPICIAGIYYYLLIFCIEQISIKIEKKVKNANYS